MASATLFSYAGGGSKRVGQVGYQGRESRIGMVPRKRESRVGRVLSKRL